MAHFAQVKGSIVVRVIVAEQDFIDSLPDDGSEWIQTSYWTRGGVHYQPNGEPSPDQSKALRHNYAGIGFAYDNDADVFIPPCPGEGWRLDLETYQWQKIVSGIIEETEE
jgi:hypothetical protein